MYNYIVLNHPTWVNLRSISRSEELFTLFLINIIFKIGSVYEVLSICSVLMCNGNPVTVTHVVIFYFIFNFENVFNVYNAQN